MSPITCCSLGKAHQDDMLREAAQQRLVAEARRSQDAAACPQKPAGIDGAASPDDAPPGGRPAMVLRPALRLMAVGLAAVTGGWLLVACSAVPASPSTSGAPRSLVATPSPTPSPTATPSPSEAAVAAPVCTPSQTEIAVLGVQQGAGNVQADADFQLRNTGAAACDLKAGQLCSCGVLPASPFQLA